MDTENLQLGGIHHLTAITAKASGNHAFYTETLGMRLVKKTVNQDDVSAYHLFYADARGTPGTDLTFFDWPAAPERRGANSIVRTGLLAGDKTDLDWWAERFETLGVRHSKTTERDGRPTLDFEDPEGQRLSLVADNTETEALPWEKSPVPPERQIRGLGPVTLSVRDAASTRLILTNFLNMRHVRDYPLSPDGPRVDVFAMGGRGAAGEVHVAHEPDDSPARPGAGGVHHVAFRVPTFEEYRAWEQRLNHFGIPSSGPVDRYYFRSLYFREPNGILFELATDGPGFTSDEPLESLGETLALPPFLEDRRSEIEAGLKPL